MDKFVCINNKGDAIMNIKTTINDNPVYFYEIPVGDIFVYAGEANIKCVLVKTDTVYNEERSQR